MLKTMNMEKPPNHEETSSIDLKAIRESKGLTLKEISYQSRISVAVLDAIENKNFHLLPEPVYTRGFIKTYAQTLEINDEDVLSEYNAYIDDLEMSQEQIQTERKAEKIRARYKILGIIIAILVVTFIIFIVTRDHDQKPVTPKASSSVIDELKEVPLVKPQPKEETPVKQEEAVPPDAAEGATAQAVSQEEPDPGNNTGEPPADTSTETEEQAATPVMSNGESAKEQEIEYILDIEATELTWLNIIEDFKPNEEILMKPGEKITRKASEKLIVFIGNAGGVNVSFQGKPMGPLGEHGKVIRLILPPKQGNAER